MTTDRHLTIEETLELDGIFYDFKIINEKGEEIEKTIFVQLSEDSKSVFEGEIKVKLSLDGKDYYTYSLKSLTLSWSKINVKSAKGIDLREKTNEAIEYCFSSLSKFNNVDQRILLVLKLIPLTKITENKDKKVIEPIKVDIFIDAVLSLGKELSDAGIKHSFDFSILFNYCLSQKSSKNLENTLENTK